MKITGERRSLGCATSVEDQIQDLLHDYPYEYTKSILSDGDQILEVGFGWAGGARILRGTDTSYEGIEVSSEAVEQARKTFNAAGMNFQRYDGRHIPFDDSSFDIVLSSHVLEHVDDPNGYLSDIKRVTRPGGKVIVVTPNGFHRVKPGERPWNRFHLREYDGPAFRALLYHHFANPHFLGLDGDDEVKSVELRRVSRARKLSKWDPLGLRYVLPEPLMFWVRKALGAVARRSTGEAPAITPSMDQIHLTQQDWEHAIHLMAVCEVESKESEDLT